MTTRTNNLLTTSLFTIILLVTVALYWPGLNSPFIFDDIPNLNSMGKYNDLGAWRDMVLFILQGDSGPTGRPVSLASFYLDDINWQGASAADFKYTNLMIHLLNGVLIFWVSLKTAAYLDFSDTHKHLFALLTATLWLLHPVQINTVLYVVQRMTQLSTLFILAGVLCYLHGRELLPQKPEKAWLWLIGGGLGLLLAVFSKENGILLVVYVLAIEYFLLRPRKAYTNKPLNTGLYILAWLPFLVILAYLGRAALNNSGYASRPFTLGERLLTETRILWDYLSNILLPNLKGNSLFHDDYVISTSWTSPPETLPAIIGMIALVGIMFIYRMRQPVLAFAIAWFLGGHLIESTTISLELYFEHRNYLPLYGPIFAIIYYTFRLLEGSKKIRPVMSLALPVYFTLILLISYQGVQQWTHPVQMITRWAEDHPKSQRTLEALDVLIGDNISPLARKQLQDGLLKVSRENNTSSYLEFRNLLLLCKAGDLTNLDLMNSLNAFQTAGFIAATPQVYADLMVQWFSNKCGYITATQILNFSEKLSEIDNLMHGKISQLLHYWQAEVHASQGNLEQTMFHHEAAYRISPNLNSLLQQAIYLSSAGLHELAIEKLTQANTDLCSDIRSCLILKMRQSHINNLTTTIKKRQEQQKKADNNAQTIHHTASKK